MAETSNHLILGYTKIGDLFINSKLTKMKDSNNTVEESKPIRLKIPGYQRPYKWSTKNACQLVDDIEEAFKSNKEIYRVGTLILHEEKIKNDSNQYGFVYNIVDGQQRTITFLLLLKCCFTLFETSGEYSEKEFNDNTFSKLVLTTNQDTIRNVTRNYRALMRRIDRYKDNKSEFKKFFEYICNNCQLIIVITDNLSEAFQFFDSQNARGKELYPHDLLKAYHLREMNNLESSEIEKTVKIWEDLDQKFLSVIFSDYLYRLKEWINDSKATKLNEQNLYLFKGISSADIFPYAQFYKGAYSYANDVNYSSLPFVTGIKNLCRFQLNTPIIAGKPFFEYTKHYFDILLDIQDNSKYEGYFINDNEIVATLESQKYKTGTGNKLTRLMLDVAILLYVDRFCPEKPEPSDLFLLDRFVELAFIWAYSMRAQYHNVGLVVAQNYILGISEKNNRNKKIVNSFNIYKEIVASETPNRLLAKLLGLLQSINVSGLANNAKPKKEDLKEENGKKSITKDHYLFFFKNLNFIEGAEW